MATWTGLPSSSARARHSCANAAAARGQPGRALRLGGAAAALTQTTGRPLDLADQAALDGGLAPARRALPAAAQATAWAAGQALPLEHAVAEALAPEVHAPAATASAMVPAASGPAGRRALPGGLTTREAEVLALVAEGRSNQEIAAAPVPSLS